MLFSLAKEPGKMEVSQVVLFRKLMENHAVLSSVFLYHFSDCLQPPWSNCCEFSRSVGHKRLQEVPGQGWVGKHTEQGAGKTNATSHSLWTHPQLSLKPRCNHCCMLVSVQTWGLLGPLGMCWGWAFPPTSPSLPSLDLVVAMQSWRCWRKASCWWGFCAK